MSFWLKFRWCQGYESLEYPLRDDVTVSKNTNPRHRRNISVPELRKYMIFTSVLKGPVCLFFLYS